LMNKLTANLHSIVVLHSHQKNKERAYAQLFFSSILICVLVTVYPIFTIFRQGIVGV
jgi:hypothetical protein